MNFINVCCVWRQYTISINVWTGLDEVSRAVMMGWHSLYSDFLQVGESGVVTPMGAGFFRPHQYRPRGPPSLFYNGYRVFIPGVKRPGRGRGDPSPSRAGIENKYSYRSASPQCLLGMQWGSFTFNMCYRFMFVRQRSVFWFVLQSALKAAAADICWCCRK
jgi:hypothetical protein